MDSIQIGCHVRVRLLVARSAESVDARGNRIRTFANGNSVDSPFDGNGQLLIEINLR